MKILIVLFLYLPFQLNAAEFNDLPNDIIKHITIRYLPLTEKISMFTLNKRCSNILKPIIVAAICKKEKEKLESYASALKNRIYLESNKYIYVHDMVQYISLPQSARYFISLYNMEYLENFIIPNMLSGICDYNRLNLLSLLFVSNLLSQDNFYYLSKFAIEKENFKVLDYIVKNNPEIFFCVRHFVVPIHHAYNKVNVVKYLYKIFGLDLLKVQKYGFKGTIAHHACNTHITLKVEEVLLFLAETEPSLFEMCDNKGETVLDILYRYFDPGVPNKLKNLINQLEEILVKTKPISNYRASSCTIL